MQDMMDRMDLAYPIPLRFELALRKRIKMLKLAPEEHLPHPAWNDSIVYIKTGLMKETCTYKGKLEKLYFAHAGDYFMHSTAQSQEKKGEIVRLTAIDNCQLYCIGKQEFPDLLETFDPGFKLQHEDAVEETSTRWLMRSILLDQDPAARLRFLCQRFPRLMRRAKKEDIAACMGIEVAALDLLLLDDEKKKTKK